MKNKVQSYRKNSLGMVMSLNYNAGGKGSKCFMGSIIIFSLLSAAAAASIAVLTLLSNNSGLSGEASISVQTCSSNYFASKFSNIHTVNRIVFISSLTAALISLQISFIALSWFCKKIGAQKEPRVPRGKLFFFCGCLAMSSVPPLGHYFTFFKQLKNCAFTADQLQIIIILGACAALTCLTILISMLIMCKEPGSLSEQKYKVVETYQTQANQIVKQLKNDWKSGLKNNNLIYKRPNRQINEDKNIVDETNQAIVIPHNGYCHYSPPQYKPRQNDYKQYLPPSTNQRNCPSRKPPIHEEQKILENIHPRFINADPAQIIQAQKNNKRHQLDVEDAFFREQNIYIQSNNNCMLPRGGLQQRDMYHNRNAIEYTPVKHKNYAVVNHRQNDRSQFFSPVRQKNSYFQQNARQQYISNDNHRSYPQQQYDNYQNNFRHPHQRNKFNQNNRNFNSRQYEQQQSFRFYQQNYPRSKHYYR